jgi:hypothetical protein
MKDEVVKPLVVGARQAPDLLADLRGHERQGKRRVSSKLFVNEQKQRGQPDQQVVNVQGIGFL